MRNGKIFITPASPEFKKQPNKWVFTANVEDTLDAKQRKD
jgi:hypothetical protein